jgi:hypothetical protein
VYRTLTTFNKLLPALHLQQAYAFARTINTNTSSPDASAPTKQSRSPTPYDLTPPFPPPFRPSPPHDANALHNPLTPAQYVAFQHDVANLRFAINAKTDFNTAISSIDHDIAQLARTKLSTAPSIAAYATPSASRASSSIESLAETTAADRLENKYPSSTLPPRPQPYSPRDPILPPRPQPYSLRNPILPPRPKANRGNVPAVPRPQKHQPSYRAWPAYRQAIADRERNAKEEIAAVRAEYIEQRNDEINRTATIIDQLNDAIAAYRDQCDGATQRDNVQRRQEDLDGRAKALDRRIKYVEDQEHRLTLDQQLATNWRDTLLQETIGCAPTQSQRLSRVFIQLTDILKAEGNFTTPLLAFELHRRIAPALHQLTLSLGQPDDEMAIRITPDDAAVKYYALHVRRLQHALYDDEWEALHDVDTPYETDFESHNPRPLYNVRDIFGGSSTDDSDKEYPDTVDSPWGSEWD